MTLTTTRRQMANRLLDSGSEVVAFAAGWAAGTGVDRLLPRTTPGRLALVLGGALAGALAADELLFTATGPLRDRLREPVATLLPGVPATLADAHQVLTTDAIADAEHQAAFSTYTIDHSRGLVSKTHMWSGYPDGNASLRLAPGTVLFCRRTDGLTVYELAQAHTPDPVEVTSIAQLLQLLPGTADLTDTPHDGQGDDVDDDRDLVVEPDLVLGATSVD
ncbi:hypothetical protein [Streptacidiphilus neutrinimicus]|uniref:hypothetical protein n=1 Tax=Streptacidiphilus neutrinimicus TaxID=105420 RepID=UPI0012699F0D|nr:hypothetical protein [Streptacidiphilus neutrinimicus]